VVPAPVAIGMTVCDYVIVEERTRKISTIGSFSGMKVARFPSIPQRFCVFAGLTDSQGRGTATVAIKRLADDLEVYSHSEPVNLPERLAEVPVLFRIQAWSFPSSGRYEVALLVDGETVSRRRLRVYSSEGQL